MVPESSVLCCASTKMLTFYESCQDNPSTWNFPFMHFKCHWYLIRKMKNKKHTHSADRVLHHSQQVSTDVNLLQTHEESFVKDLCSHSAAETCGKSFAIYWKTQVKAPSSAVSVQEMFALWRQSVKLWQIVGYKLCYRVQGNSYEQWIPNCFVFYLTIATHQLCVSAGQWLSKSGSFFLLQYDLSESCCFQVDSLEPDRGYQTVVLIQTKIKTQTETFSF